MKKKKLRAMAVELEAANDILTSTINRERAAVASLRRSEMAKLNEISKLKKEAQIARCDVDHAQAEAKLATDQLSQARRNGAARIVEVERSWSERLSEQANSYTRGLEAARKEAQQMRAARNAINLRMQELERYLRSEKAREEQPVMKELQEAADRVARATAVQLILNLRKGAALIPQEALVVAANDMLSAMRSEAVWGHARDLVNAEEAGGEAGGP